MNENMKKIFIAICYELGALQEDVNAYRTDIMKAEPVQAKDVADDLEFHVDRMIGILKMFDLNDLD